MTITNQPNAVVYEVTAIIYVYTADFITDKLIAYKCCYRR